MERMTYQQAREYLIKYNEDRGYTTKGMKEHCTMVAVIDPKSFNKEYSLESRSYEFTNDNKAFLPSNLGYSIFASSLDGSDPCVRLEKYLRDEEGGKDGWIVEYCYILKED